MLLLLIFNDKYSITYWLSVSYLIYSYYYVIIRVLLIESIEYVTHTSIQDNYTLLVKKALILHNTYS